ncbi:NAD(P)/FAD-dependent oxidoreductase [Candidatus Saccharibacteria bacterium]|nr:NAD(P)/FAD-dependent oxidoreductase [Candidatus Saccharibacteria bacterium]
MSKRFDYDLAVIGSGDAGGKAALIAAESGRHVVLIEANKWGGSSLNSSNVPFGALFHASQIYKKALDGGKFGISSNGLRYNYPTVNNWKNVAMRRAKANSKTAFEASNITCIKGKARFISKRELAVDNEIIQAKYYLIATGASVLDTGIKIPENVDYWLPEDVLNIIRPPKSLFIIGAGSTGCELAQYFATLGTEVIIADIAGRLLPREDEEVGQVMDYVFNKDKIKVLTQSRVIALEKDGQAKRVIFLRGGQEKSVRVDEVLMCTGSAPNVDIGLENAGVKFNRSGISVDITMRTSQKHIYAAGDVVGGHSSTEKAEIDARVAAMHIIGRSKAIADYRGIIRVTDTFPEVAQVGETEDDCLRSDKKITKVVVPLDGVMKANISDTHNGFIKLIVAKKTNKLLGATVVAPNAGIIAQELAFALCYDLTADNIALVPHLTNDWSALVREACERL